MTHRPTLPSTSQAPEHRPTPHFSVNVISLWPMTHTDVVQPLGVVPAPPVTSVCLRSQLTSLRPCTGETSPEPSPDTADVTTTTVDRHGRSRPPPTRPGRQLGRPLTVHFLRLPSPMTGSYPRTGPRTAVTPFCLQIYVSTKSYSPRSPTRNNRHQGGGCICSGRV